MNNLISRKTGRGMAWLAPLLRLAPGGVVLVMVAIQITDLASFRDTLAGAHPVYLIGCAVIYYIGVWISCIKWQLLLNAQGVLVGIVPLMRWYLAGAFTGSFLPSDVGGDLGRGMLAGRVIANKSALWSSIALERLTGLAGMLVLAGGTLALSPALLGWPPLAPLAAFVALVVGTVILGTLLVRSASPGWLPLRFSRALAQLRAALAGYGRKPQVITICLALSLLYHTLTVLSTWFVLLSLAPGTAIGPALVAPLVSLIGVLPLTPGGLGVREGVQAVLLQRAGVDGAMALAAALVSRALLWALTLGGLPALLSELRPFRARQANRRL